MPLQPALQAFAQAAAIRLGSELDRVQRLAACRRGAGASMSGDELDDFHAAYKLLVLAHAAGLGKEAGLADV